MRPDGFGHPRGRDHSLHHAMRSGNQLYAGCWFSGLSIIDVSDITQPPPFRPWLLFLVPAVGALIAGAISWFVAPETRGGGSDAIIRALTRVHV